MVDEDLTTGPVSAHFRKLAVPGAVGMVFSTLYNVVDVYFAGQISTDAQAGLVIGFQAFFIMMPLAFGLGAAMGALVGNARGQNNDAVARRIALQGLSFAIVATLILLLIGAFLGPQLILLVSQPGEYRLAANGYFYWLLMALPGFIITFCGNGILQAHGDTVTMQRAMIAAFFANIGLNPLFIYGVPGVFPGIGLDGIALATVISQTGVMIFTLRSLLKLRIFKEITRQELMPNIASYREVLAQMIPTASAMGIMFISGFAIQFALKGFGEDAIAAYGIALRIEQILLLPVFGMTGALLPIAAQNFGAGNQDRVRDALWFCWKVGGIIVISAAPILWLGGGIAMSLFTNDPDVIRIGISYLRIDCFLFPIYMMLFTITSFLQALKKPIWTLWISLYRQGFAVLFFVWIFVGVFDTDVCGVWIGIATAVTTGWMLAVAIAIYVAKSEIGGLRGSKSNAAI
ncbi:MAG: MATE family efflux transporter [Litoreibacter sp.]